MTEMNYENREIIDVEAKEAEMQNQSVTEDFIMNLEWNGIGSCVVCRDNSEFNSIVKKAATICRRRFRPADVILISILDEAEEGESGIAFTNKAMYYWTEDDTFISCVNYADILNVDYDEDSVNLLVKREECDDFVPIRSLKVLYQERSTSKTVLPCVGPDSNLSVEEKCEYARNFYNFIADIVDEVNK